MVDLGAGIVSVGLSTKGLGAEMAKSLGAGLGEVDQVADKAGGSAATSFGSKFKTALVAAGIVTAIAGAFNGLLDVGSTFDTVSDTIRVQTGATGDELRGLESVAEDIGKTIPASFENIGDTVSGLNQRLGLTDHEPRVPHSP